MKINKRFKNNKLSCKYYVSPKVEVYNCQLEAILCGSCNSVCTEAVDNPVFGGTTGFRDNIDALWNNNNK